MSRAKKILVIASLFYPQEKGGGPITSLKNLVFKLGEDYEVYVITKNYEIGSTEKLSGIDGGWVKLDNIKVYYFNYGTYSLYNIYKVINEIKPDFLYQNSFFSYDDFMPTLIYRTINFKSVKLIVAPRGEFVPNRLNKNYRLKYFYAFLLKYSRLLNGVRYHAASDEEATDIKEFIGAKSKDINIVSNIPTAVDESKISFKYKNQDQVDLVFISRIHPTKNLLFAIKVLSCIEKKVNYDIYGPIEDKEYWKKCENEIMTLPSHIVVKYKGIISPSNIPKILENYHVFFMPTIGENYGHAIVEALLNCRPVIISDKTPWSDCNKYAGYICSLDSLDSFKVAINEVAVMNNDAYLFLANNARKYILSKFNTESLFDKYIKMFSS